MRDEQVIDQVRAWIKERRIGEQWAPLVRTTTSWIASAAPAWASVEHRALACLDLGTCFFLLDDCTTDDAHARYDDLEHVASGGAPDDRRPLQVAFASLFAQLAARGSIAHYLELRIEFARALRRRQQIRTGAATINIEGYFALRETTIYFGPWLSIWMLLGGFELSSRERTAVSPAFTPANRWQVLENERLSVERDRAAGIPNVISMMATQHGGLPSALALARRWADADLDAYTAAVQMLRAKPLPEPVVTYLALLEAGVDGAARHYQGADPARYR